MDLRPIARPLGTDREHALEEALDRRFIAAPRQQDIQFAAVGRVKGYSREVLAHALEIAGSISPVNSHWVWSQHASATTIKYTAAGPMVQAAMAAAHMAEFGRRGDWRMLDDAEFGYRRIIGSTRWEPKHITAALGQEWVFLPP